MPSIVSVIIPVYNASPFLKQMLDSVLVQTLKDIEVICVDDGSSDNSCEIIEEYCTLDDRVRLIRQEHANAGMARNNGLQFASGEYLAFLDADDFFEPNMLSIAVKKAQEENSDVVVFRSDSYSNRSRKYTPITGSINSDLLPLNRPFSSMDIEINFFRVFTWWPWDKLFRADLIQQNNLQFQSLRTTNDLLFVCSAVLKATRVSIVDTILAHHRALDSDGSLSSSREKSWNNFYYALRALRQQLQDWSLYERFEQDYINYCLHFSLWHLSTIKGSAYHQLYSKLQGEWFGEFGISNRSSDYFYDDYEYQHYLKIMTLSSDEYLFYRIEQCIIDQDIMRNDLNDEIIRIRNEQAESQQLLKEANR